MAHINDLPTEILDYIMAYASVNASCEDRWSLESRRLFPFNIARVCLLWLSILKSRPQYWHRVDIDVAEDPEPFLDTLAIPSNTESAREISVFSSVKNDDTPSDSYENEMTRIRRENARAARIFKALEPSLPYFGIISFFLVYQSSLPSATKFLTRKIPKLHSLSLSCSTYDLDDDESEIKVDVEDLSVWRHSHATYPILRGLSLNGYAFMELRQLGEDWLFAFKQNLPRCVELSINHFKFHERGRGRYNSTRDLWNFISLICETGVAFGGIVLSDLSLNHFPTHRTGVTYVLKAERLVCDGVSRDFIAKLFNRITFHEGGNNTDLYFNACSIPHNVHEANVEFHSLDLGNIPFHTLGPHPTPAGPLQHPNLLDDSLINALTGLNAVSVTLADCEGVTDELLFWLAGMPNSGRPLQSLYIVNCSGFTLRGLRESIERRARVHSNLGLPAYAPLSEIWVEGGWGPVLAEEDAAWFAESQTTRVFWNVDDDGSGVPMSSDIS